MSSHEKATQSQKVTRPEDERRTHTTHKESSIQYPSVSLYQPGDKVWHSPPNERSMVGPLQIVAHQGNETYTLSDVNTGQTYNGGVAVSSQELQRA